MSYGQAPAPLSISAIMLNGNMHQRAPVGSASTTTNTMTQRQINKNTPTAMKMGIIFVFLDGALL